MFWTRQARDLKEPNSMYKIVLGCGLLALSYLLVAYASWQGGAGKVTWLWMLAFNALLTTAKSISRRSANRFIPRCRRCASCR